VDRNITGLLVLAHEVHVALAGTQPYAVDIQDLGDPYAAFSGASSTPCDTVLAAFSGVIALSS
jgi:hypothetical protein